MMGVNDRSQKNRANSATNTTGITYRARSLYRASHSVGSGMVLFAVFSMRSPAARISVGSTVNTQSMLMKTPLASTKPSSRPILNVMNARASRPTTVVSELERMEGNARSSAAVIAARGCVPCPRCSR